MMKKRLFSIGLVGLMLIAGLAVIGCSKDSSPSAVVTQFLTALEKGDSAAVGEFMTPESAQLVAMFGEKGQQAIAATGGVTSTEETIDGDTAVVKATFKDGSSEEFDLVKIDGKWKVTIQK
jgi:hypothetical protein